MKIAVMTDTNSGIAQAEAEEKGIFLLSMPFMIDEKGYLEGKDLSQEEFYRYQESDANISTSQPSPEDVMEMWDRILTDYDEIVHIPMSSGLSGSCQTALMLADEYDGRVQVVDNHRVSITQRQSVMDALGLAEGGFCAVRIKEELERAKDESVIYIMVDTLRYLKKGGRITPAAAALGTLLKLKPVLSIQGEKLDAFAKARTMKQAKSIMVSAILKDLETKLFDKSDADTHIAIAHTQNEEAALAFREELLTYFPDADIYIAPLSLSIACHTGPGTLAVAATKKLCVIQDQN